MCERPRNIKSLSTRVCKNKECKNYHEPLTFVPIAMYDGWSIYYCEKCGYEEEV